MKWGKFESILGSSFSAFLIAWTLAVPAHAQPKDDARPHCYKFAKIPLAIRALSIDDDLMITGIENSRAVRLPLGGTSRPIIQSASTSTITKVSRTGYVLGDAQLSDGTFPYLASRKGPLWYFTNLPSFTYPSVVSDSGIVQGGQTVLNGGNISTRLLNLGPDFQGGYSQMTPITPDFGHDWIEDVDKYGNSLLSHLNFPVSHMIKRPSAEPIFLLGQNWFNWPNNTWRAVRMNNHQVAVGYMHHNRGTTGNKAGVKWVNGVPEVLPRGDEVGVDVYPQDINDAGQIVGFQSYGGPGVGVIFENGRKYELASRVCTPLNDLLIRSGQVITQRGIILVDLLTPSYQYAGQGVLFPESY